jgi:DNA repair exonuclease SbcCD nuclease subunit
MKIAMFTDIHWGAKNNSVLHNNDCIEYVSWFIDNLKAEKCDAIAFLGDWFENRNAINVQTLNRSYDGLKMLDELGLPIYFCTGNHDLYHRASRELYSTYHFNQFKNVILVNEITQIGDSLFSPFLFREEYSELAQTINSLNPKYVFGHFEFRNFVITGSDRKMEHGPDHSLFSGPKYIFSGHYHKRQARDNVVYIGNTFPTNYGDIWDDARGMAILDTETDDVDFIDWEDCPKYRKVKLSDIISDPTLTFPQKCRVRCLVDIEIGYSEAQSLREEISKQLNLREFSLEENVLEKKEALEGEETDSDLDLSSIDDAVVRMIKSGLSGISTITPDLLVDIYQKL